MSALWLRQGDRQTTLTLHIQPGAKKTEVAGEHGDALKIRLAAPPVDGKANAALIAFVADRLGLAKSAVSLLFIGTAIIGCGIALGNVLLPGLIKRDFAGNVARMTGAAAERG